MKAPEDWQKQGSVLGRFAFEAAALLWACCMSAGAGEDSAPPPKKFSEVIKSTEKSQGAKDPEEPKEPKEAKEPEPPPAKVAPPKESGKGHWPIKRDASKAAPAAPAPLDRVPEAEVPAGKAPPKVVQRREVPAGDTPTLPAVGVAAPVAKGTPAEAQKAPPKGAAPAVPPRPEPAATTAQAPKAEAAVSAPPKGSVPAAEAPKPPEAEPPPKAEPGQPPDEATYGYTTDNPILIGPAAAGDGKASGLLARVEAAKAFLRSLRDAERRPFESRRTGSVPGRDGRPIDRYELIGQDEKRRVIYMDVHAPAAEARPRAPKGMVLAEPEAEPAEK